MSRLVPSGTAGWERFNARIIACRRCPRLVEFRQDVARLKRRQYRDWEYWGRPVPGFGDLAARLLLVGLAPAAHGANRTGRMFTGDSSGDWLYGALHRFGFASQASSKSREDGLRLKDAFVSAAARCCPPGNRPTTAELDTCRPFLVSEFAALERLRVVVALGQIAHGAFLKCRADLGRESLRPAPRFRHGGVTRLPEGLFLITSYHPSRQNTQTGRLTRSMWYEVFQRAHELLANSRP